jgi:hypothetical protein
VAPPAANGDEIEETEEGASTRRPLGVAGAGEAGRRAQIDPVRGDEGPAGLLDWANPASLYY